MRSNRSPLFSGGTHRRYPSIYTASLMASPVSEPLSPSHNRDDGGVSGGLSRVRSARDIRRTGARRRTMNSSRSSSTHSAASRSSRSSSSDRPSRRRRRGGSESGGNEASDLYYSFAGTVVDEEGRLRRSWRASMRERTHLGTWVRSSLPHLERRYDDRAREQPITLPPRIDTFYPTTTSHAARSRRRAKGTPVARQSSDGADVERKTNKAKKVDADAQSAAHQRLQAVKARYKAGSRYAEDVSEGLDTREDGRQPASARAAADSTHKGRRSLSAMIGAVRRRLRRGFRTHRHAAHRSSPSASSAPSEDDFEHGSAASLSSPGYLTTPEPSTSLSWAVSASGRRADRADMAHHARMDHSDDASAAGYTSLSLSVSARTGAVPHPDSTSPATPPLDPSRPRPLTSLLGEALFIDGEINLCAYDQHGAYRDAVEEAEKRHYKRQMRHREAPVPVPLRPRDREAFCTVGLSQGQYLRGVLRWRVGQRQRRQSWSDACEGLLVREQVALQPVHRSVYATAPPPPSRAMFSWLASASSRGPVTSRTAPHAAAVLTEVTAMATWATSSYARLPSVSPTRASPLPSPPPPPPPPTVDEMSSRHEAQTRQTSSQPSPLPNWILPPPQPPAATSSSLPPPHIASSSALTLKSEADGEEEEEETHVSEASTTSVSPSTSLASLSYVAASATTPRPPITIIPSGDATQDGKPPMSPVTLVPRRPSFAPTAPQPVALTDVTLAERASAPCLSDSASLREAAQSAPTTITHTILGTAVARDGGAAASSPHADPLGGVTATRRPASAEVSPSAAPLLRRSPPPPPSRHHRSLSRRLREVWTRRSEHSDGASQVARASTDGGGHAKPREDRPVRAGGVTATSSFSTERTSEVREHRQPPLPRPKQNMMQKTMASPASAAPPTHPSQAHSPHSHSHHHPRFRVPPQRLRPRRRPRHSLQAHTASTSLTGSTTAARSAQRAPSTAGAVPLPVPDTRLRRLVPSAVVVGPRPTRMTRRQRLRARLWGQRRRNGLTTSVPPSSSPSATTTTTTTAAAPSPLSSQPSRRRRARTSRGSTVIVSPETLARMQAGRQRSARQRQRTETHHGPDRTRRRRLAQWRRRHPWHAILFAAPPPAPPSPALTSESARATSSAAVFSSSTRSSHPQRALPHHHAVRRHSADLLYSPVSMTSGASHGSGRAWHLDDSTTAGSASSAFIPAPITYEEIMENRQLLSEERRAVMRYLSAPLSYHRLSSEERYGTPVPYLPRQQP